MLWRLKFAALALLLGWVTPAAAQSDSPVLERISERGTINVGHREGAVPFSYISQTGEPIGYSIDLCGKIIDRIKETIGNPDLTINYVPVTSANRIALMAGGNVDIECGTTAVTLGRLGQVNFLPPHFATAVKLLVKKDSGIAEIEDLKGKSVGVTLGTTEEKVIRDLSDKQGLDINIVHVKEHTQGGLALETDRVDAYTTDDVLLYGLLSQSKQPGAYDVVGRELYLNLYAIMIPRHDDEYQLLGRTVIADLMRTGEILPIYKKWFTGPDSVGMPLNDLQETLYMLNGINP